MHVFVYGYAHMHAHACRDKKKISDPLQLVRGRCDLPFMVVGSKLQVSSRASALNGRAVSLTPVFAQ